MLVNTMTPEELVKEAKKDYPIVRERMLDEEPRYRRKFLKAVLYPVTHTFKYKSPRYTIWTIMLMVRYRHERKHPACVVYSVYDNNGLGAYYIKTMNDTICLHDFTPHFFKRYRERYLIPNGIENLTIEEQVNHFFLNSGLFGVDFGNDETTEFVGYTENGVMLGTMDKSIGYICVKTYVPNEMFFKSQSEMKEFFNGKRKEITSSPSYFAERGTFFKLSDENPK